MANNTFLRWRAHVKLLKFQSLSSVKRVSIRSISTNNENEKDIEETDIEQIWAEEERKANLERVQNVSGLPPEQYRKLHGGVIEPPFKDLMRRKNLYIAYGSKSGEDPRLLWPSRQEIAEIQAEEEDEEVPLMEKIQLMRQEKEEKLKARNERRKMIERNMSQMNKWISEYHGKVKAADLEVQKRKEKQEALLDEARDYFGYSISANDPKFEQMVEEKQDRERKEAREQKKKDKANKLAEKLRQDVLAMKMLSGKEEEEKPSSS